MGLRGFACAPNLLQHASQLRRSTRDRRRTKRGHAELREATGHAGNRRVAAERIHAFHAVHVDVDESWNDVMSMESEVGRSASGGSARLDVDDTAVVDDDSAWTEDAVRQHHLGARQDDHSSSLLQSVCT